MPEENCRIIQKEIQQRINRIKGQIQGIEKMVGDQRSAVEIAQQISAVRSALSNLGIEILKSESKDCFKGEGPDNIKKFEELVETFFKIS